MTNVNPKAYTITVQEIEEEGDRIFEATISELPDAVDYAGTASEAYDLAIQTIENAAKLYAESDRNFPSPRKREDEYSGRVTLRMPKTVHAQAYRFAEDDGTSLNQFILAAISEKIGYTTAINHFENIFHSFDEDLNFPLFEDISADEVFEFGGEYSNSTSLTSGGDNVVRLKVVGNQ